MGKKSAPGGAGVSVGCVSFQGWSAVRLTSGAADLTVIPELGAKIVSLRLEGDASDFLWQDDTRPLRPIEYGGQFGDYDASGFDECFPTIGECAYPEDPWRGVVAPDHGELWTLPWTSELSSDGLVTRCTGMRFPYVFERRIAADGRGGGFLFQYRATNLSSSAMKYLWSAHPLFAASEGMQVLFPGAPKGRVIFAAGGRLTSEAWAQFTWPWAPGAAGAPVDYSRIGPADWRANDKVVLDTPSGGWCALYDPALQRYCGFRLEARQVPCVAVCINHGWFPFVGSKGYWVAIEPCSGYPDPLDEVIDRGLHATLPADGCAEWSMELRVGRAASAAEAADAMQVGAV